MAKQIKVALFYSSYDATKDYAEQLAAQLDTDEVKLIDFQDPYPCAQALPMRANPSVAILLFVDSLEDVQEKIDVLRQLGYIKKQDDALAVVDELIDAAGDNVSDELQTKIADTFYSKEGA